MNLFFSWLLLALVGIVSALSSSGSRLLVVLEETTDKDKYSQFWGDLKCKFQRWIKSSTLSDNSNLLDV